MSPQAAWILKEEVAPRLRSAIPRNVNLIGSEDYEELVQDSICMAAKLLQNAENQNKQVTPGNISYYTILHMKSGRRSHGYSNADVLGSATQLNGRSSTSSFDEPVTEADEWGEEFTVNDVLSLNDEDPGQKAARNLDWNALMDSLTERERRLVECLVDGMNWTNAALSMGVSSWTVAADREKLSVKILEFMGVDILAVILKRPGWKNNLNANRERLACKHQRGN